MKIKEFNPTGNPANDPINGGWTITSNLGNYVCDSAAKTKKGAEKLKSQLRPELKKVAVIRKVTVRYVHVKGEDVEFSEGKRWGVLLPNN